MMILGQRTTRMFVASLVVLACLAVCSIAWAVGVADYTEDYCTSRTDPPTIGGSLEGTSGRPGYMDGPLTVRCDWDRPNVTQEIFDPRPLAMAVVLAVLVATVAGFLFRWAMRPR